MIVIVGGTADDTLAARRRMFHLCERTPLYCRFPNRAQGHPSRSRTTSCTHGTSPNPDASRHEPVIQDEQRYNIFFVGEDGKPIPNARLYLYEMVKDGFLRAIYRDREMNTSATFTCDTLPKEFLIGVTDSQNFYKRFWRSQDIVIRRGNNTLKLEKSGVVSLVFSAVDLAIAQQQARSPVVMYYKQSANGTYEVAGGIGGWPRPGLPIEIDGLSPGEYRFELKPSAEAQIAFWKSDSVQVAAGKVTSLVDLKAAAPK